MDNLCYLLCNKDNLCTLSFFLFCRILAKSFAFLLKTALFCLFSANINRISVYLNRISHIPTSNMPTQLTDLSAVIVSPPTFIYTLYTVFGNTQLLFYVWCNRRHTPSRRNSFQSLCNYNSIVNLPYSLF